MNDGPPGLPRARITIAITTAIAIALAACNVSGLSNQPRATFSQLACLDANGDHRLNAADAADPSKVPDFNADFSHDAQDAAFLRGIDIPLDAAKQAEACKSGSKRAPEYLVAHGFLESSDVDCGGGNQAVLLAGVGGGVVNLRDREDAAGVRSMIDALQKAYDDRKVQTIGVIAGPAIVGAQNVHTAMEEWMTHAVRVYLDRFPCLRVLLLGHSHGAITADVIASRLEREYSARIIQVVDVDRVETLYIGDTRSRPKQVRVFNIYEKNDAVLAGAPYDAPNVANWDASEEMAPRDGQDGGPLMKASHTTIDNSKSVRDAITGEVMGLP